MLLLGLKSLCLIDLYERFWFIGPACPGAPYDIMRFRNLKSEVESNITEEDGVALDK